MPLNSMNPDLEHKTRYCGLQRTKRGQKSIGPSVSMYVIYPSPAFFFNAIECKKGGASKMQPLWISKDPCCTRNHKSQSYKIQNLSSIQEGQKEYSKLLVEIGTREVGIHMKDFSFFFFCYFLKTALTIFFNTCTYQW